MLPILLSTKMLRKCVRDAAAGSGAWVRGGADNFQNTTDFSSELQTEKRQRPLPQALMPYNFSPRSN